MQQFVDAMAFASRLTRGDYHLTLGQAITALESVDDGQTLVQFDWDGKAPTYPHSYRGYYSDLAFKSGDEPITAERFLRLCRTALGSTYTGYKGGNFVMDTGTPLWAAQYGDTGRAITGIVVEENVITLVTREDLE